MNQPPTNQPQIPTQVVDRPKYENLLGMFQEFSTMLVEVESLRKQVDTNMAQANAMAGYLDNVTRSFDERERMHEERNATIRRLMIEACDSLGVGKPDDDARMEDIASALVNAARMVGGTMSKQPYVDDH